MLRSTPYRGDKGNGGIFKYIMTCGRLSGRLLVRGGHIWAGRHETRVCSGRVLMQPGKNTKQKKERAPKQHKKNKRPIYLKYSLYTYFFFTLLLPSFWTSRGHRCRPFFPPILAFNFYRARVQQSHCPSIFHRVLLTHALALSASQIAHKKKSPGIDTRVWTRGDSNSRNRPIPGSGIT